MRTLLLAVLMLLGMARSVWAFHCPQVESASTVYQCIQTVFNDTGSAVTSGSVVAWDDDDTDFSTSNFPYVTTTTTADDPYTAGVIIDNSCADQSLCSIVVYGPVTTRIADATDDAAVDTLVGATTVAGMVGDYATGANTCALGMLVDVQEGAGDGALGTVFVDVDCD